MKYEKIIYVNKLCEESFMRKKIKKTEFYFYIRKEPF